jgi:nucleotide-binding universal stress UspA family protein
MFKKILCAGYGSENSFKALAVAAKLAAKFDSQLHVVLVEDSVPIGGGTIETVKEEKRREDRLLHKYIKRIDATAEASKVKANTHAFTGHPVRRIVAFAKDNHFDMLSGAGDRRSRRAHR